MDRLLYISMTGAKQIEIAQAINTNNLANANTTGFRADLAAFRSMPVFGAGHPSRVYAMAERPGVDMNPGPMMTTGRNLDIAVNGDGWLAVQASDGSEAYTRNGDLVISSLGILETRSGRPIIGNAGPIAIPPSEEIVIATDGTISIRPLGQTASALAVIDRIKIATLSADQLYKDDEGLIRMQNGNTAEVDVAAGLVSGALEASNVNPIEAMVNMIALARQFEMQIKLMQTAKTNDEQSTRLMSMS